MASNISESLATAASNDTTNDNRPIFVVPPSGMDTVPLLTTISIIAGVANLATIWAFCRDTKLRRKPSDYILLSLACADLGVALLVMPRISYVRSIRRWPFGEIGCRVSSWLSQAMVQAGKYVVILLSWDRYKMLSMEYTDYLRWCSHRRMARALAVTWMLACLKGTLDNIFWRRVLNSLPDHIKIDYNVRCVIPTSAIASAVLVHLFENLARVVAVAIIGVLIIVKLSRRLKLRQQVRPSNIDTGVDATSIVMNSLNVISLVNEPTDVMRPTTSSRPSRLSARRHTSQQASFAATISTNDLSEPISIAPVSTAAQPVPNKANPGMALFRKRYIKPVMTYVALVLSLLICTLPVLILTCIMHLEHKRIFYVRTHVIQEYLSCLKYFNSCLNPCLYALTNARIRQYYRGHFRALVRNISAWRVHLRIN